MSFFGLFLISSVISESELRSSKDPFVRSSLSVFLVVRLQLAGSELDVSGSSRGSELRAFS